MAASSSHLDGSAMALNGDARETSPCEPKPVQVEDVLTITGGFLTKPFVPFLERVGEHRFMPLTVSDNDLAIFLAGRVNLAHSRVLSRVTILDELRRKRDDKVQEHLDSLAKENAEIMENPGDSAIRALGLDAEPEPEVSSLHGVRGKKRGEPSPHKTAAWTQVPDALEVVIRARSPKNRAAFCFLVKKDEAKKVASIAPTKEALQFLLEEVAFALDSGLAKRKKKRRVGATTDDSSFKSPEPKRVRFRTMDGSPIAYPGDSSPEEPRRGKAVPAKAVYFVAARNAFIARGRHGARNVYKSFRVRSPGTPGARAIAKSAARTWAELVSRPGQQGRVL